MKKYKIGYTTGVFDLFHVGHLNILKKSKEQCEYLIVGVSTDELVCSYKGRKPVISFEDRVNIIKELKCVDKVVPQVSLDKMDAWNKYHFNVIFHGSDWKNSDLYKDVSLKLNKVGVDVVFLPYTDNISSSLLREKILNDKNK